MAQADIPYIYSLLLSQDYQDRLFSDLKVHKRTKADTYCQCPFCHHLEHFSFSNWEPVWRCFSCGRQGDWLRYLEERNRWSFLQALQQLAAEAKIELDLSEGLQQRHQQYAQKASIMKAAQAFFQEQLFQSAGLDVLNYAFARGYTDTEIKAMGLGAYVSREKLLEKMAKAGFSEKEVRDAGLLSRGLGETHKLTLLWTDPAGMAVGMMARSLLSREEMKEKSLEPYLFSTGADRKSGLVGLAAARKSKMLIMVEGALDALYLSSLDRPTVAIGGTELSLEQIKALEANGTRELILAMDMDAPGRKATAKIIRTLLPSSLRVYVLSLSGDYKDPDEFVRLEGLPAFDSLLAKVEKSSRWMAGHLLSGHDLKTDRGLDEALEAAGVFYEELERPEDRRLFQDRLREATGLPLEELESRLAQVEARLSQRKSQDRLQALVRELTQKASEGDVLGAEQLLSNGLQQLRSSRGIAIPEPYLLPSLQSDILDTVAGLTTGFESLAPLCLIPPGAITIIAGRPGHGKTTLQLNLMRKMIKAYPQKSFYFFSYEEASKFLALKLIMAMAGEVLEPSSNLYAYVNYFMGKRGSNEKIEKAIKEYDSLTQAGRLHLSDQMLEARDLAAVIGQLGQREETGAIFVDYIQRIPVQKPAAQRYLDIKASSAMILEQAIRTDVPIIMGAQLSRAGQGGEEPRLENLRESGDIEQDASLILALYNASIDKVEEGSAESKPTVDLKISILKNRGGVAGRKAVLSMTGSLYRITDKTGSSKW